MDLARGQVSVPATFRAVIETADPDWVEGRKPQFVIVFGDHRRDYLECFTMTAMNEIDEAVDRMVRGSVEREMVEELFYGQSHPAEVQPDGRIVIPKPLREKVGLGESVLFLAAGDRFHIWNPATYAAKKVARTRDWLDRQPPDFDPASLLPGRTRG
ncbi:MAG: cell division/cell wall cluster transcriptional repressor MraZ [Rhodobacteraceae bacterium]|nr:cell division/cell wall cluster transcriptional repressor MraZ [Paracoccaceae bacterium]